MTIHPNGLTPAKALDHGVFRISAEDYHRDPCPEPALSSSLARTLLAKSPLHAWTESPRLNPNWQPTESKTFDIGRAAHRAILGAGGDYVAIPEELLASNGAASTKAAKAFIDDARADGKTPLKREEIEQIDLMAGKLRRRLALQRVTLDPAMSEQVAIAKIDGVFCRAMLDNVPLDPREPIYDFKTCENANPEACLRAILNYGLDVQAAHYRDTWKAATGEEREFRFIFQEKQEPHEVCIVQLGADSLSLAARKIRRAREIWGLCLTEAAWPGYGIGVHMIDLPAWAIEKWLERESFEAEQKRVTGRDVLAAAFRLMAPENYQPQE